MKETPYEISSLIGATGVGSTTLVGFIGEFPLERGNCFSVRSDDGKYRTVLNFGHENFEELFNRKILSYPVEILPLTEGHCLIADHRIPKDWYDKKFCTICTPPNLLPPQQKLERLLDLRSGKRKETKFNIEGGASGVLVSHETTMPSGYVYAPWVVSSQQPSLFVRAKTFFRKLFGSPNKLKAYSEKSIDSKFYKKTFIDDHL